MRVHSSRTASPRRSLLATFTLMVLLLGALPFAYSQATDWQQIPIPTLPPFHPAEPKRVELPNGLVIFLQEDHELPLIDGSIRIRGGSRDESAQKVGLVQLYGDVWRTGTFVTHPWLIVASDTGGTKEHGTGVRLAGFEPSTSVGGEAVITDRR